MRAHSAICCSSKSRASVTRCWPFIWRTRPVIGRLPGWSPIASPANPPSDSKLLDDGIRVLSRLFAKSREHTGVKLRLTDYRKRSNSLVARIFYAKKARKRRCIRSFFRWLTGCSSRDKKPLSRFSAKAETQVTRTPGLIRWSTTGPCWNG